MNLLLKKTKKVFLFPAILLFPFVAKSQQAQELYTSRAQLIEADSSTTTVDRQLYALNERFPAIVHVQSSGAESTIVFPYFLEITPDRKDRIIQRLTAYYTWITSMNISEATNTVTVSFHTQDLQEQLGELVSHFGYIGYEIAD